MSARSPVPGPRRRLKYGSLPVPVASCQVAYAKRRPELKGLTPAEATRLILDSPAFQAVVIPKLAALDTERGGYGREPLYSSLELESIFVYQRARGLRSVKEARAYLGGDHQAQQLLGFDRIRRRARPGQARFCDTLPSESTLSRHRRRFGEQARLEAYRELERRLRDELLTLPEIQEGARILDLDGSAILTHFTPPKLTKRRKDGRAREVTNAAQVTAPDAGYVPGNGPKSGSGWQLISMTTEQGMPLAWQVSPLHENEAQVASRVIDAYARDVLPHLDATKVGVLSADSAFARRDLRLKLRANGLVDNIHEVSHARRPTSEEKARKEDRRQIPIHDPLKPSYSNWFANGHRELFCRCRQGRTERITKLEGGRLTVATVGRCSNCGTIRITAGRWRLTQNPRRFVRCQPGEPGDESFGNPLTFHDPLASRYGTGRFGHQEGFHGQLVSRFQLLKGKRWFRRQAQAETDVAVVFSLMHVLALERHRRFSSSGQSSGLAPPGPPGAQAPTALAA